MDSTPSQQDGKGACIVRSGARMERMEQKILNHQRAARRRKAGIWTVAGVMAAAAAVCCLRLY